MRALLLLLFLLLSPRVAEACSCGSSPIKTHFDRAAVVAEAVVLETQETRSNQAKVSGWMFPYEAQAKVLRLWKGGDAVTHVEGKPLLRFEDDFDGAGCGFGVEVGQTYILFLYRDKRTGVLHAGGLCAGHVRAVDTERYKQSVEFLGPGWLPAPTSRGCASCSSTSSGAEWPLLALLGLFRRRIRRGRGG